MARSYCTWSACGAIYCPHFTQEIQFPFSTCWRRRPLPEATSKQSNCQFAFPYSLSLSPPFVILLPAEFFFASHPEHVDSSLVSHIPSYLSSFDIFIMHSLEHNEAHRARTGNGERESEKGTTLIKSANKWMEKGKGKQREYTFLLKSHSPLLLPYSS